MKKMYHIIFVMLFGFLSTQVYAGKVLQLNPNESKLLTNHYLWTVNATCNVDGEKNTRIVVSMLKNKGNVNGLSLTQGQKTSLSVKNHDRFAVSAEPGTQVNLTNVGTNSVQAVCSA